jgi:hypothetical protein
MRSECFTYDHLNNDPANQAPELILMYLKGTLLEYIPVLERKRKIRGISGVFGGKTA